MAINQAHNIFETCFQFSAGAFKLWQESKKKELEKQIDFFAVGLFIVIW